MTWLNHREPQEKQPCGEVSYEECDTDSGDEDHS